MLSYQNRTKLHICENMNSINCCMYSFLCGLIITAGTKIDSDFLEIFDLDRDVQKIVKDILKRMYRDSIDIDDTIFASKEFLLISGDGLERLYDDINIDIEKKLPFSRCFENECCVRNFIKGVYVGCGRLLISDDINQPSRGYTLEISVANDELMQLINNTLISIGVTMKQTSRVGRRILYIRDGDGIVAFLHLLNVDKIALELFNDMAMRSVKNNINRQNNCFDANQNKTIETSVSQISAINSIGIDNLSPSLQQVAILRMDNPDASLSELCDMMPYEITRAGMKYRLDRILRMSKNKERR